MIAVHLLKDVRFFFSNGIIQYIINEEQGQQAWFKKKWNIDKLTIKTKYITHWAINLDNDKYQTCEHCTFL